jgi:hypothetical protein
MSRSMTGANSYLNAMELAYNSILDGYSVEDILKV